MTLTKEQLQTKLGGLQQAHQKLVSDVLRFEGAIEFAGALIKEMEQADAAPSKPFVVPPPPPAAVEGET